MASATFTGHFVHAVARQPRLLPRCMSSALPIKFFIFGSLFFPFCIMLACSANENKKYVCELLFKSTLKVAHLPGESVRVSSYTIFHLAGPQTICTPQCVRISGHLSFYIVVAITSKSPSRSASQRFILAPRPGGLVFLVSAVPCPCHFCSSLCLLPLNIV